MNKYDSGKTKGSVRVGNGHPLVRYSFSLLFVTQLFCAAGCGPATDPDAEDNSMVNGQGANNTLPLTVLYQANSPAASDPNALPESGAPLTEDEIKNAVIRKLQEIGAQRSVGQLADFHRGIVTVKDQPDRSYLVVHLLSRHNYSSKTVRLDLDANWNVTSAPYSYQEEAGSYGTYASCPDNSVDIVLSTCETGIPTAVRGINDAANKARSAGYNVRTLIGRGENRSAVLSWLSCPNLVGYGRIGHGNESAIIVADGKVSRSSFNSMFSNALRSKVLFFNSCQVHNSPFEPAVRSAGAQKFIGGDSNLAIGRSESVFVCWHDRVLNGGQSISNSLNSCVRSTSGTGRFGISGGGSDTYPGGNGEPPGDNNNDGPSCSRSLIEVSNGGSNYGKCEGDCDSDSDCQGNLRCFKINEGASVSVPGCLNKSGTWGADYCYDPGDAMCSGSDDNGGSSCTTPLKFVRDEGSNYGKCQGDCDRHSDCQGGLMCHRIDPGQRVSVPGCLGLSDTSGNDYCYDPSDSVCR